MFPFQGFVRHGQRDTAGSRKAAMSWVTDMDTIVQEAAKVNAHPLRKWGQRAHQGATCPRTAIRSETFKSTALVGWSQVKHDTGVLRMLVWRAGIVVIAGRRPPDKAGTAILVGGKILVEHNDRHLGDHNLLDGSQRRCLLRGAGCRCELLECRVDIRVAEALPVGGVGLLTRIRRVNAVQQPGERIVWAGTLIGPADGSVE